MFCFCFVHCLNERFEELEQLKFLALLDTSIYPQYGKKFREQLLQELKDSAYGKLFSITELMSDLTNVYSYTDLPSHLDEVVRHKFDFQRSTSPSHNIANFQNLP